MERLRKSFPREMKAERPGGKETALQKGIGKGWQGERRKRLKQGIEC